MDDNDLIEWLRTSGSDLDPCLDAADTIERLQRELADARARVALLLDAAVKAQRGLASAECYSWRRGECGECGECDVCFAKFVVRAALAREVG